MEFNKISNKEDFMAVVINELKEIGVKYRKEKKDKKIQEKTCQKRIFHTHLHSLELTEVIVSSGNVVRIPKFVADACNRIFEQIDTEGIFRKAGSSLRQKEIRISLESGVPLGKSHHVIDVANLLKFFFRELPEPIIPPAMQETFLRSLVIGENQIRAILLTCLLLPPLTLNTMSFFMQFLHSVTLHEKLNKMSAENLAIIFTPGLMPLHNIASHRFANHIKLVRLLIENANEIGTLPDSVIDKLQIKLQLSSDTPSQSCIALENMQKTKKKKRRSEMFNGLRKIVGSAIGSSENLENIPDAVASDALATDKQNCMPHTTPCIKTTKKRKFTDPVCAFSAKKKRDLLALLPSNSGGLLPNTPQTKQPKKSRISLGGTRNLKKISINPVVTSIERRWSTVGSSWSKQKIKNNTSAADANNAELKEHNLLDLSTSNAILDCNDCSKVQESEKSKTDLVQISKTEYEAIKERVEAIETRISREFGTITQSILNENCLSGPERVLNKYEKMIVETEALSSPTTEKLAQRLSRGLNIRRSIDQHVVRSPSARKIGTMRRRSQEKSRLSRTQTWHHSSAMSGIEKKCPEQVFDTTKQISFYANSKVKRGRPSTFLADQPQPGSTQVSTTRRSTTNDEWTSGEIFFNNMQHDETHTSNHYMQPPLISLQTPAKPKALTNDNIKTPMLPPKSVPRRHVNIRTPNSAMKLGSANKCPLATPTDDANGRASIARLRTANAGMVMAKAKLFDGLGVSCSIDNEQKPHNSNKDDNIGRRQSLRNANTPTVSLMNKKFDENNKQPSIVESPRAICKKNNESAGGVQKRHQLTKYGRNAAVTSDQTIYIRNIKNIKEAVKKTNASPRTSKLRTRFKPNSPRRINKQFAGNELYEIYSPSKQSTKNSTRFNGRFK